MIYCFMFFDHFSCSTTISELLVQHSFNLPPSSMIQPPSAHLNSIIRWELSPKLLCSTQIVSTFSSFDWFPAPVRDTKTRDAIYRNRASAGDTSLRKVPYFFIRTDTLNKTGGVPTESFLPGTPRTELQAIIT